MSWRRIKHGYICERMIGFSLPISGEIAVVSYEGVHIVQLAQPNIVVHHRELAEGGDNYDCNLQRLELNGRNFTIFGLHGSTPRSSSSTGELLAFGEGDSFDVHDAAGNKFFSHVFNDMSGDWRVVTFTPDDKYILLGLPYELDIFERTK